jgi:hypothetical protein
VTPELRLGLLLTKFAERPFNRIDVLSKAERTSVLPDFPVRDNKRRKRKEKEKEKRKRETGKRRTGEKEAAERIYIERSVQDAGDM